VGLQVSDDGSMVGTSLEEWQVHVKEATKGMGRSWDNVRSYAGWMKEVGFLNVEEVTFRWPSCQVRGLTFIYLTISRRLDSPSFSADVMMLTIN
jgi:hypothetical protein